MLMVRFRKILYWNVFNTTDNLILKYPSRSENTFKRRNIGHPPTINLEQFASRLKKL